MLLAAIPRVRSGGVGRFVSVCAMTILD